MRTILFLFCSMLAITGHTQVDTSYRLLWYAGKKIKENVLLTPARDTVRFDPAKRTLKVTSPTGELDEMLREINRTPQRIEEMIASIYSLPKSVLPSYSSEMATAFREVETDYRQLLANTITLPDLQFTSQPNPAGKGGWLWNTDEDDYEEVIKELKKHMWDHFGQEIQMVPEPPAGDFEYCNECNSEKKKNFRLQMDRFLADLRYPDNEMMIKALGLSVRATRELKGDYLRAVQKDISIFMLLVQERMKKKLQLLVDRYADDPLRAKALLEASLTIDREIKIYFPTSSIPEKYGKRICEALIKRLEKAWTEKDYPVALNIKLWAHIVRYCQLFKVTMPKDLPYRAVKFNHFKLGLHISAKANGDVGHVLAEVKGDNWYMAVPDKECRMQWLLIGPHMNKLEFQLLALEMKSSKGSIPYVGTRTWNSTIPTIRVDFGLYPEPDSITTFPFHAANNEELWTFPQPVGTINAQQSQSVLTGCFMDVEQLKREGQQLPDVEQTKKEMLEQAQQALSAYKSQDWSVGSVRLNGEGLEKVKRMQEATHAMTKKVFDVLPGRYIFTPSVYNKNPLVVRDKLNGKTIFPENAATEYAWFDLRLEHDPDGKYQTYKPKK